MKICQLLNGPEILCDSNPVALAAWSENSPVKEGESPKHSLDTGARSLGDRKILQVRQKDTETSNRIKRSQMLKWITTDALTVAFGGEKPPKVIPPREAAKSSSSQSGLKAPRKTSNKQREILTAFYEKNPFPNTNDRIALSKETGMDLYAVRIWFKNRRRMDRAKLEAEESLEMLRKMQAETAKSSSL